MSDTLKQEPYWEYVSLVVSLDDYDDDDALTEHITNELGILIQQAMQLHQDRAEEVGNPIKFTDQRLNTCYLAAPRPRLLLTVQIAIEPDNEATAGAVETLAQLDGP
jgi:hypothetical protein